jgi:phosphate transport system substrate-binding protein
MDWKIATVFLIIGLLVGFGVGYIIIGQPQASQESGELTGNIVVKGSDTLLIVAQRWAENFSNRYPGVTISVAGGGSGTGFAALKDKTLDIADASRQIKDSELQTCKDNGVNPVEWVVGLDGISIVVHPDNPQTELTLEQLEKIYNGTYTNWNQVGGNDATIVTYGRQS